MDKNTITGLVLIAILLVGFSFLSRPNKEQLAAQQRYYDSIAQVQQREADLKAKAEEYGKAKESSSAEEVAAIEHAGQREAARDLVKKERDVAENNTSIIQKATPRMVKKLQQAYTSRNFVKALRGVSKESREADIAALNEVIDIATKLKEKIESIE